METESISRWLPGRRVLLICDSCFVPIAALCARKPGSLVVSAMTAGLFLLTSGCSTVPEASKEARRHIIMVGADGQLLDPAKNKFPPIDTNRIADYFGEIVAGITNSCPVAAKTETNQVPKKQILIFVHGGLNTISETLARVESHLTNGSPDGVCSKYYPVFINWNSGFLATYWEHLWSVRQGEIKPGGALAWSKALFPLYFIADAGRALLRFPIVLVQQIDTDRKTLPYKRCRSRDSKDAEALYCVLLQDRTNALAGISVGNDHRGKGQKATSFLRYLVMLPIKFVTAPVIDTGGTSAWENMLRRTKTMFRTTKEFDLAEARSSNVTNNTNKTNKTNVTNRINRINETLDAPRSGAVAQFMQYLSTNTNLFTPTNPFSSEYEITLVGHSMGTIILNEVIRGYGNLPYKKIIYMGAACTIKDFEDSVIPYLQQHRTNGVHFYNLCLNPLAERREAPVGDLIPRGSLLEWIDNFLSSPQTVPDRTLGKFENFVRAAHLIPLEVRGQVHVKAFGVQGSLAEGSPYGTKEGSNLFSPTNQMPRLGPEDNFQIIPTVNNPQKHGDFSKAPFWDEAFWKRQPSSLTSNWSPDSEEVLNTAFAFVGQSKSKSLSFILPSSCDENDRRRPSSHVRASRDSFQTFPASER